MAVSGRFSALVNRVRYGDEDDASEEAAVAPDDLIAAIRAMTAETFGDVAIEEPAGGPAREQQAAPAPAPTLPPATSPPSPQPPWLHLVFFSALVLGGVLAKLAFGTFAPAWGLRGAGFSSTFGDGAGSSAVLLFGGVLTGFGTRMAGGCTSGHGLCGVSRLQPGSLLATAAFFGTGILMSLALEAL